MARGKAGGTMFRKEVGPIDAGLFVRLWDETFVIEVFELIPAPC